MEGTVNGHRWVAGGVGPR